MQAYERLLHYVTFRTDSAEDAETTPTTPGQHGLAQALAQELTALGLADVLADEHAYVYGRLPATPGCEGRTPIGFIAHIDTVPLPPGAATHPAVVPNYDGGDLPLGGSGLVLSPAMFPHLPKLAGETLIVTDGTTVLGADDKAGVAEIVTAMERLLETGAPHGDIYVGFTPDEEIGHGAALLDLERFAARYAYTVDGSDTDELEYETFNAASAVVRVRGVEVHPGSAKGVMKNASSIAAAFAGALPADETPETTEGREGFYHLTDMRGSVGAAELSYILRDHDRGRFEARKRHMQELCRALNERYGEGTVTVELRDQYYNMAEKIAACPAVLDRAEAALRSLGIEPVSRPVRGGTDGAQLSFRGLPCPNLGTGGFCFHGPYEHITAERMDTMVDVLTAIATQDA